MRQDNNKELAILFGVGIIPVIWIALLVAPHINGGMLNIVNSFSESINNPFKITKFTITNISEE